MLVTGTFILTTLIVHRFSSVISFEKYYQYKNSVNVINGTADKFTNSTFINNEFKFSNGNYVTSVNWLYIKTIWEFWNIV